MLLMTFIDKPNFQGQFEACFNITDRLSVCLCKFSHLHLYLLRVKVQLDSCILWPVVPPPGILMKKRSVQTCNACPTTLPAHSGENFDINDLCHICIQT